MALFTYVILLLAGHPYHLGPGLLAAVSAVYLLGMVTTPIAGRRLRRFHERVPLSVGAMLFVSGIALTLLTSLWAVIAGMALASAGTFLSQSAATSFVGASAPGCRAPAAIGIYTTFYYVGGSIGAVAPGALWTRGGWPAVAYLRADRRKRPRHAHRGELLAECDRTHRGGSAVVRATSEELRLRPRLRISPTARRFRAIIAGKSIQFGGCSDGCIAEALHGLSRGATPSLRTRDAPMVSWM
ncbi:MAG: MFS transporter [Rhodospirillales bacterium]